MNEHELKLDVSVFRDVVERRKTAEFRRDDRGFEVGDWLHLLEWSVTGGHTGRGVRRRITHVQRGFGIPAGFVMLSIK